MSEAGTGGAGGTGGAATVDYGALYGTLSAENREVFDRKAFGKAGGEGKPIDINGVFDWARNAEKMVGADHIEAPRLDDDKAFDEWKGHEKLGVPKDAKDYKFERPNMPDGVEYDEVAENALRAALSKAKIGQKQATRIYNDMIALRIGEATRAITTRNDARTQMDGELRQSFGASFDAKMQRGSMAIRYAAEQAGIIAAGDTPEQIKTKLGHATDGLAAALGNTAAVKIMVWLGGQLGEDVIKGGKEAGFAPGRDAAKAEIASLQGSKDFNDAYYNRDHPGHKAAVERMSRLHEQSA